MIIYTYNCYEQLVGSFELLKENPLSFVHSEHNGMLNMAFLDECEKVTEGGFIGFEDVDGEFQMFEVTQSSQTHSEEGLVYEYGCEHVYYELLGEVVDSRERLSQTPVEAAIRALSNTRWSLGKQYLNGEHTFSFPCQSVLSALTKIEEQFNCRMRYRLTHNNGEITGRYVDIIGPVENETGKHFTWGKDIMSLTRKTDTRDIYTALYGQGKSISASGNDDGGTDYDRLDFSEIIWLKPVNPVNKHYGDRYVADEQALALYGRGDPDNRRHRFGVAVFDNIDDPNELLEATWELLQTVNKPKVSYTIKALDFAALQGDEFEAFRIGDKVGIVDTAFSPALETYVTIAKVDRDYLYPENTDITLGSLEADMSDILHKLSQSQAKLRDKEGVIDKLADPTSPIQASRLEGTIDALSNQIVCSDSYQQGGPNEGVGILLENTDTSSANYGALYLGPGVFSIANTKQDTQWQWRTLGNGTGLSANYVNKGEMSGNLITKGTIGSSNGKSYINLDNGSLSLGDGAMVFNGYSRTVYSGDVEITGGGQTICVGMQDSSKPMMTIKAKGAPVGFIYARNSDTMAVEATGELLLSGSTGVNFEHGPIRLPEGDIVLPNGQVGYTGSFSISGRTLFFQDGLLYSAVIG